MQVLHRPSRGLESTVVSAKSVNKFFRRVSLNVNWLAFLLLTAIALLLSGCGGSGYDFVVEKKVSPTLEISWLGRSRSVLGPSSALSATISVQTVPPSGTPSTLTVNRAVNPADYTQGYSLPTQVRPGPIKLSVEFFAATGGGGANVGSATTDAVLTDAGLLTDSAGAPISGILTSGKLGSLEVNANQTVEVGGTTQLTFTAKDGNGGILALTPGSGTWSYFPSNQNQSQSHVSGTSDGQVSGSFVGADLARVRVDNVDSALVPVTVVLPANSNYLLVNQFANAMAFNPINGFIYASVPSSAPTRPNTITVINPATGAIVNSVDIGSDPNMLAFSSDYSVLYVALSGSNSVRPVVVNGLVPGTAFSFGSINSIPLRAKAMAVIPGQPNSIVVSTYSTNSSNSESVAVYDSGVARPVAISSFVQSPDAFAFGASPSKLYGYGDFGGYVYAIDSNGISVESTNVNLRGTGSLVDVAGKIFDQSNRVVDEASLSLLGTLPGGGSFTFAAVSADGSKAFLTAYGDVNRYRIASTTDFTQIGTATVPFTDGGFFVNKAVAINGSGFATLLSNNDGIGQVLIIKDAMVGTSITSP